jgi:large subunit ribosomal protein L21
LAGVNPCYANFTIDGRANTWRRYYGEVKIGDSFMKYAIIESGGKQYRAVEGTTIEVDLMKAEKGDKISLDGVLLLVDDDRVSVGTPLVDGVRVSATVVGHIKGPKIVVFKYRPKKHYRVKTGHRQQYTRLQVDSIEVE